jgi:hypothetical protein
MTMMILATLWAPGEPLLEDRRVGVLGVRVIEMSMPEQLLDAPAD